MPGRNGTAGSGAIRSAEISAARRGVAPGHQRPDKNRLVRFCGPTRTRSSRQAAGRDNPARKQALCSRSNNCDEWPRDPCATKEITGPDDPPTPHQGRRVSVERRVPELPGTRPHENRPRAGQPYLVTDNSVHTHHLPAHRPKLAVPSASFLRQRNESTPPLKGEPHPLHKRRGQAPGSRELEGSTSYSFATFIS